MRNGVATITTAGNRTGTLRIIRVRNAIRAATTYRITPTPPK